MTYHHSKSPKPVAISILICRFRLRKKREEQYKLLNNLCQKNVSCELFNYEEDSKSPDVIISLDTAVREKRAPFTKEQKTSISSISKIVNEIPSNTRVNIIGKVFGMADVKDVNGLKIRECKVTDGNGDHSMQLTLFAALVDSVKDEKTYKFTNLNIANFNNRKILKTTHSSTVAEEEAIAIETCNLLKESVQKIVIEIDSVDTASLTEIVVCPTCRTKLQPSGRKLVTCNSCHGKSLASSCKKVMNIRLKPKNNNWLTVPSDVIRKVIPEDIAIGDNEDFVIHVLSTKFTVNVHENQITKMQEVSENSESIAD